MAATEGPVLAEMLSIQRADLGGSKCQTGNILREMDPKLRGELEAILEDHRVYGTTIAKWLKKQGHEVSSLSVNRHRRNGCACVDL